MDKYSDPEKRVIIYILKFLPEVIREIIIEYYFNFEGIIDKNLIGHKYPVSFIEVLSDGRMVTCGGSRTTDRTNECGARIILYDPKIIIWDPNTGVPNITINLDMYSPRCYFRFEE